MNHAPAKMHRNKRLVSLLIVIVVIVAAGAAAWWWTWQQRAAASYSDCVKQGNVVLYSYPSVCIDQNGKHFTNPAEQTPIIPQNAKPL